MLQAKNSWLNSENEKKLLRGRCRELPGQRESYCRLEVLFLVERVGKFKPFILAPLEL